MRQIFTLLLILPINLIFAQSDTSQIVQKGRRNSVYQQDKPYVILISADGFRYDLADAYQAKNLLKFSNEGAKAKSMIPTFPSITFPNHYSIITGLYASHHGIIDNKFYDAERRESYSISDKKTVSDGSWYGGIPLWTLAEREKMLTASLFWVGSESEAGGIGPTYFYHYNDKFSIDRKIKIVTDWLRLPSEKRPHLITFYFPEVDHELHMHGVGSQEGKDAVQFVDAGIGKLVERVRALGLKNVNFVFVSDHGMMNVEKTVEIPEVLRNNNKLRIANSLVLLQVYVEQGVDIQTLYQKLKKNQKGYRVYLKSKMPSYLHFGTKDDRWNRIGDIILMPDGGTVFIDGDRKTERKLGKHGYDPYKYPEMHAAFMAWGDQIKPRRHISSFENVEVYPFVAKILGLHISNEIDGKKEVLNAIMR